MTVFYAGFEHNRLPVRVSFGAGIRHNLARELTALGLRRGLVLTTPEQAAAGTQLVTALGSQAVGLFTGAVMHTPHDVTQTALSALEDADCLIAIGGGSTIGLGKAIALRTGLPQVVLPTTYAGSEATPVLGQTRNGIKETLRDPKLQPLAVIYDPELVTSLPIALSVTSGLNAMAHAVEALYARDATPLSSQLAMAGLTAFCEGLPQVVSAPDNIAAREKTQFGAWACGTVLAQVGMALHHKLCHTLGGLLNLPHAQTHAILLPHTAAYNDGPALAPLAKLLDAPSAGQGLYAMAQRLGAPLRLADLGVTAADLERATALAVQNPYWNPRDITAEGIRALLDRALLGQEPRG